MWIVCFTTTSGNDRWDAFDNEPEARAAYAKRLTLETTYTASLCVPIESTDYSNPLDTPNQ